MSVSAAWMVAWGLIVATSFWFLPIPVATILVLAVAFYYHRRQMQLEWQRLSARKMATAKSLRILANELREDIFDSQEMLHRVRELGGPYPELQLPTILTSLLKLPYPTDRQPRSRPNFC